MFGFCKVCLNMFVSVLYCVGVCVYEFCIVCVCESLDFVKCEFCKVCVKMCFCGFCYVCGFCNVWVL